MTEDQPSVTRAVSRAEALRLLAGVPYGRIVFTRRALPAIHLVTHVVDDGDVLVHLEPDILPAVGQVVAYEADQVGDSRLEWSVVAIGVAALEDATLRIHPELVTGHILDGTGNLPATA